MRRRAALAGLLAVAGAAHAHGGLAIEDDVCKLRLGPFNMHFVGYQPDVNGNREFCEDIPRTGRTIVVLDAIEPELRSLPIEVRIVRDTGDESRLDTITVLHLPPKAYPAGSVPMEMQFDQPGRFVGLVTAGDKGQYASRFPFSVGQPRAQYGAWALGALAVLAGVFLYRHSGRVRQRGQEPTQA